MLASCGAAPSNQIESNQIEAPAARTAPSGLDLVTLTVEGRGRSHAFTVEIARTASEQEQGLMNRRDLAPDAGMLFPFDPPRPASFWMRNTLIPLSVAFLGDDGSVVNIDEMKPQTLDSHCSAKPVRFVLEMNEGWFAKRGIKAGSRLRGGPFGQ